LFGEREDFVRGHEVRAGLAGIFSESAVAAVVAAQGSQRDEHFFRKGDDSSLPASTDFGGGTQDFRQGSLFG